ncbi:MAG: hypothetical protein RLZZ303_424 [Candidatus Hydrogenedentota bacterium]|jgi:hypothetical protein
MGSTEDRAVVVHAGGIGDLILASPAITRLSHNFALDLAGYPERLALLTQSGIGRRALSLDAVDLASLYADPSRRARDFFAGASRVVVWMNDPEGRLREGLLTCGVEAVACLPPLPPADWDGHASDYYWRSLGYTGPCPLAALKVQKREQTYDLDVVIHPGSGSPSKNWPLHHYEELAGILAARGLSVAWCCGPAEQERGVAPSARALPPLPLNELAGVLASARLYIGNDSGITHLAAAVGCPTVALFGPTNPAVWAPLGDHVRVVSSEGWPEVARVLREALGLLNATTE